MRAIRRITIALAVVVAVGMTATAALGASPHFKKGGEPSCTVSNGQVTCSATMSGLGNQDIIVRLDVAGEATFNCVSPGGNVAPGQNKVPFSGSASQTIPASSVKNGTATIGPITSPSQQPTATAQQAGCPNPNWTTQLATATVQTVTFTASQGGQTLFTCTARGSFTEGSIPLSC
jgi:hypothetical protein